jgi:hypothetical protein
LTGSFLMLTRNLKQTCQQQKRFGGEVGTRSGAPEGARPRDSKRARPDAQERTPT